MELTNILKRINENKNNYVAVDVANIVNKKVLTNIKWASRIEKALFINFEGKYDMGDNALDFTAFEGTEGLLIKFVNGTVLFIPNIAKIESFEGDGVYVFDINDSYGSMKIRFQLVSKQAVAR